MERIYVREQPSGVVTELSGSNTTNRRSLFAGRKLSTTDGYNVYNADSVEIVYRNRADVNIPSNTGVANNTGGSSNTEEDLSDGEIAGIVIGSIIGGLCGFTCMIWLITLILSL